MGVLEMRFIGIVVGCLGLAGCGLPPAITYASLVLDGGSYAFTGKSVGAHALSATLEQDCSLLHLFSDPRVEAICRDDDSDPRRGLQPARRHHFL